MSEHEPLKLEQLLYENWSEDAMGESETHWIDEKMENHAPTDDLFKHQTYSEQRCLQCGNTRRAYQHAHILEVEIPPNASHDDIIDFKVI